MSMNTIPDWLLKPSFQVHTSEHLPKPKPYRTEWIERYKDKTGKVRFRINHQLRSKGSEWKTPEPTALMWNYMGMQTVLMPYNWSAYVSS